MLTLLYLSLALLQGDGPLTLDDLRSPGAKLEKTIPFQGYVDGPAWSPDGWLLYADRRRDQLLVWQPGETPIELIAPAGAPAGITFDSAGFAYVCQHGLRRIVRMSPQGMNELVASEHGGKRLNSPENLCLDAEGGIWFTDPRYGQMHDVEMEDFLMGVYRVHPETGEVVRVIEDLKRPNGIAMSPDASVLYVGDTDDLTVNAYPVVGPGKLGERSVIFRGQREDEFGQMVHGGGPDGLAVDELGHVYACFRHLVVLDPSDGRLVGTLEVPEWATDASFGGEAGRTLFVAARNSVYSMEMLVGGVPWRAPAKRFEGREAGPVAVDFGWERLFDGESLEGWTPRGGRYDGDAVWTVEGGAIVGREGPNGEGGLLYTERAYRNFELELEVLIDHPFDSGVFVRMVPEEKGAQVTLDWRPDGEIGGIYSDGWLKHQPAGAERFRAGGWNRVRVVCVGDLELLVHLNGEHLTYYALPPGAEGYAASGLIGIQVHGATDAPEGNAVRIRNVRLRELDPDLARIEAFEHDGHAHGPGEGHGEDERLVLTDAGRAMGWRPLFDGESLDGWEPVGAGPEAYRTGDGVLSFLSGHEGYLRTTEDYRDFTLRLDFAIERMANSGVFLRGDRAGGNPAFSGCEVQILDDYHWEEVTGSQLAPYQLTGGLYGSVAPATQALLPVGQWNSFEITYRGTRIRTVLNGQVLYDVDTLEVPGEPPFSERAPAGFIGLQQHAPPQVESEVYVRFRNLWILPH